MSGIDRVLAGIVLVCAVGGAASFARHSGSDSPAQAVGLSTPPLQHIAAPGSVLYTQTPAPTRVVLEVRHRSQRPQAPMRAAAGPIRAPKAQPAPTPAPKPPLIPQEASRALAAVPLAPAAQPAASVKAHGRALGHTKQHGHGSRPEADDPLEPAPATAEAALDSSQPSPADSTGHGHAKGRATPDGD
jgi:hypothetical protein